MGRITFSMTLLAIAVVGAMAPSADAASALRYQIQTGANLCTLSVPTTDTKVRPRATGFNNEGTTNAFVICSFDAPPGAFGVLLTEFTSAAVYLVSLDGVARNVTCTGVNSLPTSGLAPQYVSKTHSVSATPAETSFAWLPADFGGTDTIPYSGGAFSVTCNLPPQTAVEFGGAYSYEDIGN